MPSVEEAFRRLAIGDQEVFAATSDHEARQMAAKCLDARTEALLRLGALIAIDAPCSSYRSVVAAALLAGARMEELVAVMMAIANEVGSARVIAAAPHIALAAGYDVEAALEY